MLLAELPFPAVPFPRVLLFTAVALVAVLIVSTLAVGATRRTARSGFKRHWLSLAIYAAYVLLIALLALTSFGSILQVGHLAGYALLAHVAAAGGFIFAMVAVAFLYLPQTSPDIALDHRAADTWWASRWAAWGLIASSLAAAGTMLLSMLPVLDTAGLLAMVVYHRYAGLAVVVFAALHLFTLTCARLGWR